MSDQTKMPETHDGVGPHRTKIRALFLILPYFLLVGIKLVLATGLDTPLTPDELVYLGNARYLATGSGLTDDAGRHAYKIGYSLFLIPAFLFDSDGVGGFKAAQVINAFLLSLVFPAAYLLAGRLWRDLGPMDRMLIALCVSFYPASVVYSTTAMSINVFLPAFFAYLLAALEALDKQRWWGWALFGIATVFLYSVHERAIGIVGVATLVAVAHLFLKSGGRSRSVGFFLAAPMAVGLLRLLEVPGSRWHTGSQTLTVFRGVISEPAKVLVTISGHLEYLGFSTFGVLVAGTLLGLLQLRRGGVWESSAPKAFWLVLYGSAGSVFAISVLFNVVRWPQVRFTQWVYGRHNETVLLPLVVVALLLLRQAEKRGSRRDFFAVCLATLGLFGLLALILWIFWTPSVGPAYSFCASSVAVYSMLLHGIGWIPTGSLMVLVLVALGGLFAARWRWGVAAVTLCFALSTMSTYGDRWRERYEEKEKQRELVHLVRRIEQVQEPQARTILRHKAGKIFHFHYFNDSYFLPDYSFRGYRPGKKRPEGELVLSGGLDFGDIHRGSRMIGLENFPFKTGYLQSLWALPGELQDALAEKRWLMPRGFPKRVARGFLHARLQRLEPDLWPRQLVGGQVLRLPLELTHLGRGPWPHKSGLGTTEHSIGLEIVWSPVEDPEKVSARRVIQLPRMLYPGDTTEIKVPIGNTPELPPGTYNVRFVVVQQLVENERVEGQDPFDLTIEIVDTLDGVS